MTSSLFFSFFCFIPRLFVMTLVYDGYLGIAYRLLASKLFLMCLTIFVTLFFMYDFYV